MTETTLTAEVERVITDRLMAHIPTDPDDFPEFCQRVRAQFEGKDATIDALSARAEAAEARVAELEAQAEEFRKQLQNPRWCSIGAENNVAEIRMHRAMWEKLTGRAAMEGQRG